VALMLLAAAAWLQRRREVPAERSSFPESLTLPVLTGNPQPPPALSSPPPSTDGRRSLAAVRLPALKPRELLEVSDACVVAFYKRDLKGLDPCWGDPRAYASWLPAGYWLLAVRAFPEEAFAHFSSLYTDDPSRVRTSFWALRELARQGHPATLGFFNTLLQSGTRAQKEDALEALVYYDVPQLPGRIASLLESAGRSPEDRDLTRGALLALASLGESDQRLVGAAIESVRRAATKEGIMVEFYGLDRAQFRSDLLHAPDRVGAFQRALEFAPPVDEEDARSRHLESIEHAEWIAEIAVRKSMKALVPALKARADREVARLVARGREAELDILARQSEGAWDLPGSDQVDALSEVRLISQLRGAVLKLGGELSAEERKWLEDLRLLRSPKEYLQAAGLLAP
jgi:hypothetical protein